MKAQELFENAYFEIGRLAGEQPLQPNESQAAIRKINALMYEYSHLNLGYTEITSGGDDVTTPSWSWNWLTLRLSIALSAQFGRLESYDVVKAEEKDAYNTVLSSAIRIPPPQLNGNVPYGSGNRNSVWCQPKYYSESDDGILSEQNQTIVTEDA